MRTIFGRHRVRANFYHFVSCLYVLVMIFWGIGWMPDMASTIIGFILFLVDYIAQMYDPHPDNPGPWFKSHFKRFLHDDEEGDDVIDEDSKSSLLFLKGLAAVLICFITYAAVITINDLESVDPTYYVVVQTE